MHKEHKAGEEIEVDWAGDTMSYVETSTGEIKPAYIFVAILPASKSLCLCVRKYKDGKLDRCSRQSI